MAYHHTYGLPVTMSNCSNNLRSVPFSREAHSPHDPQHVRGQAASGVRGRTERQGLALRGRPRGRDLESHDRGDRGEKYNIGGHSERENISLVRELCAAVARRRANGRKEYEKLITFVKDRPGHDRRYAIDCSKIERELGWEPSVSLEEGLDRTVRWYIENTDWSGRSARVRTANGSRGTTGRDNVPIVDTCVITASDERQAAVFRSLLPRRMERGLYPREIDFRVYSDPPEGQGRVRRRHHLGAAYSAAGRGTGPHVSTERPAQSSDPPVPAANPHDPRRRRVPASACYVPEGKLFAPVPAPSSSPLPPVVLDVELALFLKYPWREGELLVTSGDALVDFNTDLLNLPEAPCAALPRLSHLSAGRVTACLPLTR